MEDEALQNAHKELLLVQLGIPRIDPARDPNAFAEIRRIACRLRQTGCRAIGFTPADDRVGAIALAVQIALVMGQLHDSTCIVLDANVTQPQFSRVPQFDGVSHDASGFRTISIAERVSLSTPAVVANRDVVANIAQATERAKRQSDYVLLDLTGIARWGEHCSVYDLVDGVAVVALANKTSGKDIRACSDDIPLKQRLGVVLIG